MSDHTIALCIGAGVPIAIIDAWLSIQSIFGIVDATNNLGYLVAIVVGSSLTIFAVIFPVVHAASPSPLLSAFWWLIFAIDIGTSVVGVIWYGMLGRPWRQPVDFTALTWAPANSLETAGYVAFVLLVAAACALLGKALNALSERRRNRPRIRS